MTHTSATRALLHRFRMPVLMTLAVVTYGVAGYSSMEGWSLLDALYMTAITLTTVGFREIHPLSAGGEIFTISLLAVGVVTLFTFVGVAVDAIVSGEVPGLFNAARVRRRMERMRDHYVICAYGRVGRAAAQEFTHEGTPFVVLDIDPGLRERMEADGVEYMIADPSEEQVLRDVGIDRARGLVCAVDSDAVNVFITLTARALNPALVIVARASRPQAVERLKRAGANRVVQPYALSGTQMASLALRPAVVEFFDMVNVAPDLRLEEILVRPGSMLDGSPLVDACPADAGVTILALKRPAEPLQVSPLPETVLRPDDIVIALGPIPALTAMER